MTALPTSADYQVFTSVQFCEAFFFDSSSEVACSWARGFETLWNTNCWASRSALSYPQSNYIAPKANPCQNPLVCRAHIPRGPCNITSRLVSQASARLHSRALVPQHMLWRLSVSIHVRHKVIFFFTLISQLTNEIICANCWMLGRQFPWGLQ